jgi:predicted RNase H-like nuclease (RuvC/YqgF family)
MSWGADLWLAMVSIHPVGMGDWAKLLGLVGGFITAACAGIAALVRMLVNERSKDFNELLKESAAYRAQTNKEIAELRDELRRTERHYRDAEAVYRDVILVKDNQIKELWTKVHEQQTRIDEQEAEITLIRTFLDRQGLGSMKPSEIRNALRNGTNEDEGG